MLDYKSFLTAFKAKVRRAHKSGTIWFNATGEAINELLPFLLPYLAEHLPEIEGYIPSEVFTWVMRVVLIANIIYRFKTTAPLEQK